MKLCPLLPLFDYNYENDDGEDEEVEENKEAEEDGKWCKRMNPDERGLR